MGISYSLSLLAAILVLAIVKSYLTKWASNRTDALFARDSGCLKPRTVRTSWFLGYDKFFQILGAVSEQRALRFFQSLIEETGNTFDWNMLGSHALGTQDPKNLEAILKHQMGDFSHEVRREVFGTLLGDGIFTQDGPSWKRSRDLVRPLLSRKRYEDMGMFEAPLAKLFKRIRPGSTVDLQPLFFDLSLEIALSFLIGKSPEGNDLTIAQNPIAFSAAFQDAQVFAARRARLGRLCWLLDSQKYRKACQVVHDYIDAVISRAMTASKLSDDTSMDNERDSSGLVPALLSTTQDPVEVRSQVIHMLVAGRDTTGCLLSWTFRLLPRHPQVLRRLREEINTVLPDNGAHPTKKEIKNMPYLACILKEVLRLYPPIPVNSRTALKTLALPTGGGPDGTAPIMVKKGEDVAYCAYSMHRRQDLFGLDAEEFVPERWERPDALKLERSYGYIPFHAGPRACPGRELALTEVSYIVIRFLQHFDRIEVPSGSELQPVGSEKQSLGLVMTSVDGSWVEVA